MSKALILRTCSLEMLSYNGFKWPESGPVEAPDWDPAPTCGSGLHGFLYGEGNGHLADRDASSKWLVAEVDLNDCVDLNGKVKFPKATVVFCGDRFSATNYLREHGATGSVIGATVSAGDRGTATAGDYGTATAGDYGTATAGDDGTATAGARGTATAGDHGTATAGNCGTATAGDHGTATAGARGTATAGARGTATAGDHGTATAGFYGTATAGDYGTATAGNCGTVSAGSGGVLQIRWFDVGRDRDRVVVGSVGENGIKANVKYKCDRSGAFVECV